tara:strand:- start:3953 stop:4168 length:216 start_codon:yes stop_codon:yes gene_type:complete
MTAFTHYKAVRCIESRIQELNKEIDLAEKIMDEPEMMADYHFAKSDRDNFRDEVINLRNTIEYLIESNNGK